MAWAGQVTDGRLNPRLPQAVLFAARAASPPRHNLQIGGEKA